MFSFENSTNIEAVPNALNIKDIALKYGTLTVPCYILS
jgi:hypothetical protein